MRGRPRTKPRADFLLAAAWFNFKDHSLKAWRAAQRLDTDFPRSLRSPDFESLAYDGVKVNG